MDKIVIRDLEVFCNHGVYKEEKKLGQKFVVSVDLYLNLKKAAINSDLDKSVNYGTLCHQIEEVMQVQKHDLIETVAEKISDHILLNYEVVQKVTVEVKKPWAPIHMPIQYAAVEVNRGWHRAYIALGSNMGEKTKNLQEAINYIDEHKYCKVVKKSDFYKTKPVGYIEQDDFINGVIEIKTMLEPYELMDFLLNIEKELKRERIVRWGPRTIDLDILLYDELTTEDEYCILPHPRMCQRLFVIEPLCEINPNLIHPISKKRIFELMEELKAKKSQ